MESFQQPAFDLTQIPEGYDPNAAPQDGNQYLRTVMSERAKCPAIVVRPLKNGHRNKSAHSTAPAWNVKSIQVVSQNYNFNWFCRTETRMWYLVLPG